MTFLPSPLRGVLMVIIYSLNILLWVPLLFVVAFFKFIIPLKPWRAFCDRVLNAIASNWISVNSWSHRALNRVQWQVSGLEGLKRDQWYLVMANHQTWTDILVLQKVFNRKIPFLKFFLKKELIWVPVLGLAWWAMDFPFMKRYSRAEIEKNPELKGKDLEITRRACRKFANIPVSIMNFVEGTRFSREKHRQQNSPYKNLLKPKAGGIAFVLGAMGDQMHRVLNVTICYPQGPINFWQYLCGKVRQIKVRVESLPINSDMLGNYFQDAEFQQRFQGWLNSIWAEKDRLLSEMAG